MTIYDLLPQLYHHFLYSTLYFLISLFKRAIEERSFLVIYRMPIKSTKSFVRLIVISKQLILWSPQISAIIRLSNNFVLACQYIHIIFYSYMLMHFKILNWCKK